MKKHTLLFATLLVICGTAFGQNMPKLLWEQKMEIIKENQVQTNGFGNCNITNGSSTIARSAYSASYEIVKLELETQAKVRAFDANGNLIWKFPSIFLSKNGYNGSEGYRYTGLFGGKSNSLLVNDTLIKLDNELRFVNPVSEIPFDYSQNWFRIDEEDGYIQHNTKTNEIIKKDLKEKEIWRYKLDDDMKPDYVTITATKTGYSIVSSLSDPAYKISYVLLTLDKTGKKTGKVIKKSLVKCGKLSLVPDGSFWVQNYVFCSSIGTSEMIKYDSTNKEIIRFSSYGLPASINRKDASPLSYNEGGYTDSPFGITPDGSLIYGFYTSDKNGRPKSYFFAKIDGISKAIITDEIEIKSTNAYELPNAIKIIDNDNFLFAGGRRVIGGGNFAIKNSIWANEVINAYDMSFRNIIGNALPVIKNDSLICYAPDGKVKWAKAKTTQYDFFGSRYNNRLETVAYLYTIKDSVTTKISIADGRELWSLKLKPSEILIDDIEGNSYRYQEGVTYSPIFSRKYAIDYISKLGKISRIYESPNVDFNQYGHPVMGSSYGEVRYAIDDKNKAFYANALEKQPDGTFQFIYRKYGIGCTSSNFQAQISGKTEACVGEKISISTPKQEGLTYQWQKDGKDIANAKEAIQEITETGTYTVVIKDEICKNTGTSNALKISIKPLPEATISADVKGAIYASSVKLSANTGTGLSYQWFKDDVQIPKENGTTYDADKSGKYAVSVTKEGCSKTSEPLLISILVPLANEVELGEEQVQVYPNPSNGNFKIVLPKSLKGANIQLLDSFGRERSLIHTGEQIQADGLVQGIYFLKISKNGKVVTSKVVIE
jgi:hypothetical protein